MAGASFIEERRRAEAEVVEKYVKRDAVITRVEAEERHYRITAENLTGRPNCSGAVALQRAEDLRQVLAIVRFVQANLDRVHLIEQVPRLERKVGGAR